MPFGEDVDKELAIDCILQRCMQFEILYPNADFLKRMISIWSNRENDKWLRFYNLQETKYNPLENYDRQEEWTDTGTTTGTNTQNSTSDTNGTDTNAVSAFNVTDFQNREQVTSVNHGENSINGSDKSDSSGEHKGRIHGNIGVTTSQQMAEAELALIPKLCVFDFIANDFMANFCIQIY